MGNSATLQIPQDIMDSARLSVSDLKLEMAVHLYREERLSIGKAHELAGMSLWMFRQVLASRGISPHYGIEDLNEEVATLRNLNQL